MDLEKTISESESDMVVMIVSACGEMFDRLAESIPLQGEDMLVRASGLMSAVWYGRIFQPELVVVDLWPPDDCSAQLVKLLKDSCPRASLRLIAPSSGAAA